MSPIAPFFSDWLYQNLSEVLPANEKVASVHLSLLPQPQAELLDTQLNERMELAQNISSMVLSLRKKVGINVRQPLAKVLIPILEPQLEQKIEAVKDLILSETNIKEIDYISDTTGFIKKKIKPNFKALGAKVGKDMKMVTAAIAEMSQEELANFEKSGTYTIANSNYSIALSDVEIIAEDIPGWQVTNMGNLTVALDINISKELKLEGLSRELINRLQNLRKEQGLEVTDRISVKLQNADWLTEVLNNNRAYICNEVLANAIELQNKGFSSQTIIIEDKELEVLIAKI